MRRRQIAEIVNAVLEAREELLQREVPHLEALFLTVCALGTMLTGTMLTGGGA